MNLNVFLIKKDSDQFSKLSVSSVASVAKYL